MKISHSSNLALGLVLTLLLLSCSKETTQIDILNVQEEFIVDMSQTLTEQGSVATLDIYTKETQPCKASTILYDIDQLDDNTRVTINEISETIDCPSTSGIVHTMVNLGSIEEVINIDIAIRDVAINKGTLSQINDQYQIELYSSTGVELRRSAVNLIPKKLVFGTISGEGPELINSISDQLEYQYGTSLKNGDYHYFTISNNGNIEITSTQFVEGVDNYFLIENEDIFISELQELRAQYPTITFDFINGFGAKI